MGVGGGSAAAESNEVDFEDVSSNGDRVVSVSGVTGGVPKSESKSSSPPPSNRGVGALLLLPAVAPAAVVVPTPAPPVTWLPAITPPGVQTSFKIS